MNVNNIRDMKTDAATRTTVAIKLGVKKARIYQTLLICAGWALLITYSLIAFKRAALYSYILTLPLFALHLKGVWTKLDKDLDPMLPMLVMSTFATSLLMLVFG